VQLAVVVWAAVEHLQSESAAVEQAAEVHLLLVAVV
jgi:hypothetical protein